jgi:hypothetical protein
LAKKKKGEAAKSEGRWRRGGCHCGAVAFEVFSKPQIELVDCNCSMCSKSGYLHLIVPKKDFRLLRGEDVLATYTFNTGAAKHMFCRVCGIKSFYIPRSHPDGYSVNFRCLEEPDSFASVITTEFDGREWETNAGGLKPLETAE